MKDGDGHFRQLGEAAQKAARHRRFHWSRRDGGFSDKPLWRVVAAELNIPLVEVLAFVNRLEEFANAADERGSVAEFNAAEFGRRPASPTKTRAGFLGRPSRPRSGWSA